MKLRPNFPNTSVNVQMSEKLDNILQNPTLHPHALSEAERDQRFKWHRYAASPRSSQVLCVSAFGTLRSLNVRNTVIDHFLSGAIPDYWLGECPPQWSIKLEYEESELLNECGVNQPTSIDVLLASSKAIFAVEAKFVSDAKKGFGSCNQFSKGNCAGFYGPGSDLKAHTPAWCRLESWEGNRSPRTYWSLGKEFFRPEVFRIQSKGSACPLRNCNYQLMRNFLFSAAFARRVGIDMYGVVTIAPAMNSSLLTQQIEEFRTRILLPEDANRVTHVTYEQYADSLRTTCDPCAEELAEFLEQRIVGVLS